MSRLPSSLGTALTEKDVEAAKSELLQALAKPSSKTTSKALVPSKMWPAEYLDALELCYDNMEWSRLVTALDEGVSSGKKLNKQLEAHVTNGDLYVGLALAKLNHFDVVDCASLLSLAELCPSYHAQCFRLAQDKLALTLSSNLTGVLELTRNLRSVEGISIIIEKNPSIKEARTDVDLALKEWRSASLLQRYKLTFEWTSNPVLSLFMHAAPHIEAEIRDAGVSLLGMPPAIFDKILEFAGVGAMMNTGLVNTLANERIHGSSAWRYHTLTAMNLSAEDFTPSELEAMSQPFILGQAVYLKRLQSAPHWDHPSVMEILSNYNILLMLPVQPPPSADGLAVALISFCALLQESSLIPVPALQWLVSSTNFHLTLARFISSCTQHESTIIWLLLYILSSGAKDSIKWLNDLKDAGFDRIVLAKASFEDRQFALQLLAFMKLHHLLPDKPTMQYRSLSKVTDFIDGEEAKTAALKELPGVWHLAGLSTLDTPETSMGPYFASFQVDLENIEVVEAADTSENDNELWHNPYSVGLSHIDTECVLIKVRGIGKAVTELGDLVFAEMSLQLRSNENSELLVVAHVSGLDLSFHGAATLQGFSGETMYWNAVSDFQPTGPQGTYILWKSALPDTESNWDLHTADLEALKTLRTTGLQAQRRRQSLEIKRWYDSPFTDLTMRKMLLHNHSTTAFAVGSRDYSIITSMWDEVPEEFQIQPNIECALRRRPYDTDKFYNLRHSLHHYSDEFCTSQIRFGIIKGQASDQLLSEALIVANAFLRLLNAILEDKTNPDRKHGLLTAFCIAYEFEPSEHYLNAFIKKLTEGIEFCKQVTATPKDASEVPNFEALYDLFFQPLNQLFVVHVVSRRNNAEKAATGISSLTDWMLRDEFGGNTLADSTVADALATTDSPLVRAILTETMRLESGNDFSKVHRKWSNLWGFSKASLDPVTPAHSAEFFLYSFIKAVHEETEDENGFQQLEDEVSEEDDESDSDDLDSESSINGPALIVGGVALAAAITAGAFLLGRILTKKPSQ